MSKKRKQPVDTTPYSPQGDQVIKEAELEGPLNQEAPLKLEDTPIEEISLTPRNQQKSSVGRKRKAFPTTIEGIDEELLEIDSLIGANRENRSNQTMSLQFKLNLRKNSLLKRREQLESEEFNREAEIQRSIEAEERRLETEFRNFAESRFNNSNLVKMITGQFSIENLEILEAAETKNIDLYSDYLVALNDVGDRKSEEGISKLVTRREFSGEVVQVRRGKTFAVLDNSTDGNIDFRNEFCAEYVPLAQMKTKDIIKLLGVVDYNEYDVFKMAYNYFAYNMLVLITVQGDELWPTLFLIPEELKPHLKKIIPMEKALVPITIMFTESNYDQLMGPVGKLIDSLQRAKRYFIQAGMIAAKRYFKWFFDAASDAYDCYGLVVVASTMQGGKTTLLEYLQSNIGTNSEYDPDDEEDGLSFAEVDGLADGEPYSLNLIGEAVDGARVSSFTGYADCLMPKFGRRVILIDSFKDLIYSGGNLSEGGIPNDIYHLLSKLDHFYRVLDLLVIGVVNPLGLGKSAAAMEKFETGMETTQHGVLRTQRVENRSSDKFPATYVAQGFRGRQSFPFTYNNVKAEKSVVSSPSGNAVRYVAFNSMASGYSDAYDPTLANLFGERAIPNESSWEYYSDKEENNRLEDDDDYNND